MINFKPQNPNDYAQKYASMNGISVEQAKNDLKTQFGEPDKRGAMGAGSIFDMDKTQNVNSSIYDTNDISAEIDPSSIINSIKEIFQNMFNFNGNKSAENQDNSQNTEGVSNVAFQMQKLNLYA